MTGFCKYPGSSCFFMYYCQLPTDDCLLINEEVSPIDEFSQQRQALRSLKPGLQLFMCISVLFAEQYGQINRISSQIITFAAGKQQQGIWQARVENL